MAGTLLRRLALTTTAAALAAAGTLTAVGSAQAVPGSATATGLTARWGSGANAVELTAAEAAHPDGTSAADVGSAPLGDAGTAESVRARATGSNPDGTVRSVASVGSLSMDIGMARLRTGRITATCTAAPGSTPRGSTSVNDGSFTVHGLPALKLPTDPAPGTVVVLPGGLGELVLNEQTRDANGALTVTGLRLTLSDATEKYRGRMVAASTRCAAGKADPASVEAHVVDAQAGDADEDRALAGVRVEATARPPAGGAPAPGLGEARTAPGDTGTDGTAANGEAANHEAADGDTAAAGGVTGEVDERADHTMVPAGTATATVDGPSTRGEGATGKVGEARPTPISVDCATGADGSCTLGPLAPGRYEVCVTAVPDGYRLPAEACRTVTARAGGTTQAGPFQVSRAAGSADT